MATLAIKGHPKRSNEVIEILEMLGGRNLSLLFGDSALYYAINREGIISTHCEEQVIQFSLEEFLEKFPYKVGDKVQYKGATSCGSIFEVEEMRWEENTVKYTLCLFGCNYKRSTLPAEYLQPYKEETMEEKEPEPKAPILSNRYDYAEGKCGYVIPDGYEFDSIEQGFQTEIILRPIKSQYPKTYNECCKVLNTYCTMPSRPGYKEGLIAKFQELLICRDAYWKIAGDWKPDWANANERKYCIVNTEGNITKWVLQTTHKILAFPTEEMRDAFLENFKDLIEQCKELL